MLAPALRAVRRSGWRGFVLALAVTAVALLANVLPLILVAFFAQQLIGFALVRHLAAYRDEPPPTVDETDRDLGRALIRAATLSRGALRLALANLVVALMAALTVLLIAQSRGLSVEDAVDEVEIWVSLLLVLVGSLFSSFIVLAEQRIALYRDQRVILACVDALRIARAEFGPIFALNLLASAPGVAVALVVGSRPSIAAQLAGLPLSAACAMVATAAMTQIYLSAPPMPEPGPMQ